jgi:hypothetical protein
VPHRRWERIVANTGHVFMPTEKFTGRDALLNPQPSSFLQLWA